MISRNLQRATSFEYLIRTVSRSRQDSGEYSESMRELQRIGDEDHAPECVSGQCSCGVTDAKNFFGGR